MFKKFFIIAIATFTITLGTLYTKKYALSPASKNDTSTIIFEVKPNQSFKSITKTLEKQNIIKSSLALRIISKIRKTDKLIRVGEYKLSPSFKPNKILDILTQGKPVEHKITITEGSNLADIKNILVRAGFKDNEIDELFANPKIFGVNKNSLEGYIFPDTYHFNKGMTAKEIIKMMVNEWNEKWKLANKSPSKPVGLTTHEIITLASIIEKESGRLAEHRIISSVFHNRLKIGMKLQSDPTVIYGIKNFNGNITKKDLKTHTPYNTYTIKGLPPGPICSPGESAIKAALNPKETKFLYFVSDGKGAHRFSKSYAQHVKYVKEYLKG